MNKNFKIHRSSSQEQIIKKTTFLLPRSKTPDKYDGNILFNKNVRESINCIRSPSIILPYKVMHDSENKSIIFYADYNFLNKYLELSKCVYPKSFNKQIEIYVRSYYMKEKALGLLIHTFYIIEGKYNNVDFVVERRYSECLSFRDLLIRNWPGFFIPPIPPKKAFGSKEKGFLSMRMKYLQQFFNRLSNCPHFLFSETKVFLEPKVTKYLKVPKNIYHKSYSEIYENYKEFLPFLNNYEINDTIKEYVKKFYFHLIRIRDNIDENISFSIDSQNIDMDLNKNIEKFYEDFYDFDNFFILEMMKTDKEKKESFNQNLVECKLTENLYSYNYENSLQTIYEWLMQEISDVNAMIESISSIYKYNDLFINKFNLLQEENKKLYDLYNPSYLTTFFTSIDLGKIQQKCFEITNLGKEVEIIKKLSDFMYKIVYFIEIPIFKSDKIKFYNTFIKYVHDNEMNKSEKANIIFEQLREHSFKFLSIFKDYTEKFN